MKVIAFYLPQYHTIPENDEWWGKGFTEWVNVKKAKPLFEKHNQPRIPLNNNYYNLLEDNVKKWQVDLAKEYGVSAFCFYHYWFDGHMLLEKPVEQYLQNKELDLPFCLCWANEDWTNAWKADSERKTLISQTYGGKEDWEKHFNYFLPFFKDERYLCEDEKPIIVIYRPEIISCLDEMLKYWEGLAKTHGFKGLTFMYQTPDYYRITGGNDNLFDYRIEYQPYYTLRESKVNKNKFLYSIYLPIKILLNKYLKIDIGMKRKHKFQLESYEDIWEQVISRNPVDEKSIPGAFVDWDNTSRKGKNGSVFVGATPEKFKKYMSIQIDRTKNVYHKDKLFLFAWNEWAEGGYMEPDEKYKYGYLEALRAALIENGEFEK